MKNHKIFSLLLLSLFATKSTIAQEVLNIPVADGFELTADFYQGVKGGEAAFILHQCTPGHGRSDWTPMAEKLNSKGVTVLNVDLRGFGDSKSDAFDTQQGDNARMVAQEYLTKDAPLAFKYFTQMSETPFKKMAFIGSSCGGAMNIINSINYEGDKIAAYLSAAILDFWITPEIWRKIPENNLKASLYITSTEDPFASGQSTKMFQMDKATVSELVIIKGDAHAIELFEVSPTLEAQMINWVIHNLKD